MNSKPVIMVVDDEIANIETIGAILDQDYEILFARSGEQAIQIAGKNPLDLILLDVIMPGLDGYETCRRLKLDPKLADVPVIFTTGLHTVEDEIQGLSAGAIDYVIKPVKPVSLRQRVGNHVELKRMRDRLVNMTMIDPLTGLGNRRMLQSQLDEIVPRLASTKESLSLILLDIDFFKPFNDIYGHPAGDTCLQKVAAALDGSMRRGSDFCARYGGEEFACVLPATELGGAIQLAEDMRSSVEALAIPHSGSAITDRVTISVGLVSFLCESEAAVSSCFAEADALLYTSKNNGRNRVTGRALD